MPKLELMVSPTISLTVMPITAIFSTMMSKWTYLQTILSLKKSRSKPQTSSSTLDKSSRRRQPPTIVRSLATIYRMLLLTFLRWTTRQVAMHHRLTAPSEIEVYYRLRINYRTLRLWPSGSATSKKTTISMTESQWPSSSFVKQFIWSLSRSSPQSLNALVTTTVLPPSMTCSCSTAMKKKLKW